MQLFYSFSCTNCIIHFIIIKHLILKPFFPKIKVSTRTVSY